MDTASTHARRRHLFHFLSLSVWAALIHPSLSLTSLTHSLSVVRQKATRQLSFSLCRQTPLLTLFFSASRHRTSRRQLPPLFPLLYVSNPASTSSLLCSCFSHHHRNRRKLAPAPPIFFPSPLQSNSRASSRAACHAVATTPASGRSRTGTATPTPARSQSQARSCSWRVARPGWSCTTPHTRRR